MDEPLHLCAQCGIVTNLVRHHATCFAVFQRDLIRLHPEILATITLEGATRIETRFRSWASRLDAARDLDSLARLVIARMNDVRSCVAPRTAPARRHAAPPISPAL